MKIESGLNGSDNEWDFLCLIYDNVDVNVEVDSSVQNVKLSLNGNDIYDITSSFKRFRRKKSLFSPFFSICNSGIFNDCIRVNSVWF